MTHLAQQNVISFNFYVCVRTLEVFTSVTVRPTYATEVKNGQEKANFDFDHTHKTSSTELIKVPSSDFG